MSKQTTTEGISKEVRQFRKGTKSCVECRQRKLRCIPSNERDGPGTPCQNCAAKGRHCVLQTHAGRRHEAPTSTSKDRIRHLEGSVGKLWSLVQDLRSELGRTGTGPPQSDQYEQQPIGQQFNESDTDSSETYPMDPPAHLQQLFDNEVVDSRSSEFQSPESSIDKTLTALMSRARTRLQATMPPKEDVQVLAPLTETWFAIYKQIFPPFTMFSTVEEVLRSYDGLLETDASPTLVAALLLWVAIAVQNAPPELLQSRSEFVKPGTRFVRQVSDTVDEVVVKDDNLAASIEGIEISLLWTRLQLLRSNTTKVWLSLRRCIALAELIGMPRTARMVNASTSSEPARIMPRQQAAAAVWESICVVDRIAGLMFNLPLGTAAYGFSSHQAVMSPEGLVIIKAYMNNLARIAGGIQPIDEAFMSQQYNAEVSYKILEVDQDLSSLRASTPANWWVLGGQQGALEQLMQYWHFYLTIRVHLRSALSGSVDSQGAYSHSICTQACRELAARYTALRSMLPLTFFAGRIIDLEAMTAAVYLIYTSHRSFVRYSDNSSNGEKSSQQLAYDVVQMMDSVCAKAPNKVGADVARKASKAIRKLDELLSQPEPSKSQQLALKIPMLGKVNVGRNFNTGRQPCQDQSAVGAGNLSGYQNTLQADQADLQSTSFDESLFWSMDLMMEDFPPQMDDLLFGADQFYSWI